MIFGIHGIAPSVAAKAWRDGFFITPGTAINQISARSKSKLLIYE